MYHNRILPFLKRGYMERELEHEVDINSVYCPDDLYKTRKYDENVNFVPDVIHVNPLGIKVFDMSDKKISSVKGRYAGQKIKCKVKYIDYEDIARRIEYDDTSNRAYLKVRDTYDYVDNVVTSDFIDLATVHEKVEAFPTYNNVTLPDSEDPISFSDLMREHLNKIEESLEVDDVDGIIMRINENIPSYLEDDLADYKDAVGKNVRKRGKVDQSQDAVYEQLKAYLTSPDFDQDQVPLLLGPTAVMKSQTVKQICKEFGYRLVDFRVAFTSRLDYNGLVERVKVDGDWWSSNCPMEELVTCSTGFLTYVVKAYEKVANILDRGYQEISSGSDGVEKNVQQVPLTDVQKSALEKILKDLGKYVKVEGGSATAITPVLFFDEITRLDDEGVEGVLTTLLNSKELGDISLDRCKFVAASNTPIDDIPQLSSIYDAKDEHDAAYAKRFNPIIIRPDDVQGRWIEWANSPIMKEVEDEDGEKTEVESGFHNVHPHVMEFLDKNPMEIYNQNYQVKAYDDTGGSTGMARLTPFPNYRTWVMVSDYVYSINKQVYGVGVGIKPNDADEDLVPTFVRSTVKGLIGADVGDKFCNYLINPLKYKEVYKLQDDKGRDMDDLETFIQESAQSGTPALLVGPSSLGKTARVKRYAKKTGAVLIVITLSALERADLMGFPVKEKMENYITGSVELGHKSVQLPQLNKELADLVKQQNNPNSEGYNPNSRLASNLTTKAPSRDIKQKFEEAYFAGKKIILFFDECNRVTNPAVMSALFECVSDNRIFGITFDPKRVQVFGAMNFGEAYTGAQDIDAALTARFSIFHKLNYDEGDVDSYIKYLNDTHDPDGKNGVNHEHLLAFIEDKIQKDGKMSIVSWFEEVENQLITEGTPCSRSFESLSKEINNMSKSNSFMGRVLFESVSVKKALTDFALYGDETYEFNDQYNSYKDLLEGMIDKLDSWNAKRNGSTLEFPNGKVVSASMLVDKLRTIYDKYFSGQMYDHTKEDSWVSVRDLTQSILINMDELDKRTVSIRKSIFKSFVGESASEEFSTFFNATYGGQSIKITIEMLDDKTLIRPFFENKLGGEKSSPDIVIGKIIALTKEFMDCHKEYLSYENYREFLERSLAFTPTSDNVLRLLSSYASSGLDGFVGLAEHGDISYIEKLLAKAGIVTPDVSELEGIVSRINNDTSTVSSGRVVRKAKLI